MDWKPISNGDLKEVERVAAEVWPPELYESPAAFASRARIGKGTCYVLWDQGVVAGYCIAHPWDATIPPLGSALRKPKAPCTLFIHDLSLLPAWRGRGLAEAMVEYLKGKARETFGSMALVAVNGSEPFWTSRGFQPLGRAPGIETYGSAATQMGWSS